MSEWEPKQLEGRKRSGQGKGQGGPVGKQGEGAREEKKGQVDKFGEAMLMRGAGQGG